MQMPKEFMTKIPN